MAKDVEGLKILSGSYWQSAMPVIPEPNSILFTPTSIDVSPDIADALSYAFLNVDLAALELKAIYRLMRPTKVQRFSKLIQSTGVLIFGSVEIYDLNRINPKDRERFFRENRRRIKRAIKTCKVDGQLYRIPLPSRESIRKALDGYLSGRYGSTKGIYLGVDMAAPGTESQSV